MRKYLMLAVVIVISTLSRYTKTGEALPVTNDESKHPEKKPTFFFSTARLKFQYKWGYFHKVSLKKV